MALNDVLGRGGRLAGALAFAAAAYGITGITGTASAADRRDDVEKASSGLDTALQGGSFRHDRSSYLDIHVEYDAPTTVDGKLSALILPDTLALFKQYSTSNRRINFERMQEELLPKYGKEPHSEADWNDAMAKNDLPKAYALASSMMKDKSTSPWPYRLCAALELNLSERWNGTGDESRWYDSQASKMRALESIVKFAKRYDESKGESKDKTSKIVIDQHPSQGVASRLSNEPLTLRALELEMNASLARISYALGDRRSAKRYYAAALRINPADPNGIEAWFEICDKEKALIKQVEMAKRNWK